MAMPPVPLRSGDSIAGRFIAGAFGFTFGFIGLMILVFLWLAPLQPASSAGGARMFSSSLLWVRIVGSFFALMFVAVGGGVLVGAVRGRSPRLSPPAGLNPASSSDYFHCPRCGAPVIKQSALAPRGEATCPRCGATFDIRQRRPAQH